MSANPQDPNHVGVLIIGAGFSGLGAAITLQKDGCTNFLVVEREKCRWHLAAEHLSRGGLRCPFTPVLLLIRTEPHVDPFILQTARNRVLHPAGRPPARGARPTPIRLRGSRGALERPGGAVAREHLSGGLLGEFRGLGRGSADRAGVAEH